MSLLPLEFMLAISSKDEARIEDVRRRLARISPFVLVKRVFGPGFEEWKDLRKGLPTRKELLRWVYGNSVATMLSFTRFPSETKRAIVRTLLRRAHRRDPWLTSRTLHAMAFAPGYFKNKTSHRDDSIPVWGPLYARRLQPRGLGPPRVLHVPNPPLRRIQRSLLGILTQSMAEALASSSTPQGNAVKATIFENALAHLGQRYVVTLDLRDFFPSVPFDDILRGLLTLNSPAIRETKTVQDANGVPVLEKKDYLWTNDAVVFVASLCTRRRRLPQGAPTSPFLANLAFTFYDEKIQNALGSDLVYTRYFDDITVSFSARAAGRRGIASRAQAKGKVIENVTSVLRSTPYRIHPRKTCATRAKDGHQITGIRVHMDRIDLPRKMRRRVRDLTYWLETVDPVVLARRLVGAESLQNVRYDESLQGHYLGRSRLKLERLAGVMLRHVDPSLSIERIGGQTIAGNPGSISGPSRGKEALRQTERLLSHIWRREVTIKCIKPDTLIGLQRDDAFIRLHAERFAGFFQLSLRDATRVVLHWHRVRGLSAFLLQPRSYEEATRIVASGRKLATALEGISLPGRIEETVQEVRRAAKVSPVRLTPREDLIDATGRLVRHLEDFMDRAEISLPPNWSKRAAELIGAASHAADVAKWLKVMSSLVILDLPVLPPRRREGETSSFDVLRIAAEVISGERQRQYRILHRYRALFSGMDRRECGDAPDVAVKAQLNLAFAMQTLFGESQERRQNVGRQVWRKELVNNRWQGGMSAVLGASVKDFIAAHAALSEGSGGIGIFGAEAHQELVARQSLVLKIRVDCDLPRDRWRKVFEVAEEIHKATEDSLLRKEIDRKDRLGLRLPFPHANVWAMKRLRWMRNHSSHSPFGGTSEDRVERRRQWYGFQEWATDVLGVKWSDRGKRKQEMYFDPGDLEITNLEADALKVELLRQATSTLKWVDQKYQNMS